MVFDKRWLDVSRVGLIRASVMFFVRLPMLFRFVDSTRGWQLNMLGFREF